MVFSILELSRQDNRILRQRAVYFSDAEWRVIQEFAINISNIANKKISTSDAVRIWLRFVELEKIKTGRKK